MEWRNPFVGSKFVNHSTENTDGFSLQQTHNDDNHMKITWVITGKSRANTTSNTLPKLVGDGGSVSQVQEDWKQNMYLSSSRSCTVVVRNHTLVPLFRLDATANGLWGKVPPDCIKPKTQVSFGVKAKNYSSSAGGCCTYQMEDDKTGDSVTFDFETRVFGEHKYNFDTVGSNFLVSVVSGDPNSTHPTHIYLVREKTSNNHLLPTAPSEPKAMLKFLELP
eukprot:TRINITY_DN1594_c0_g2_i5.p1 TRINITY_DN1594_c0_g2~~TRINITY_DN1594_c0_g2_i5.p1  ORF type:complete len:221 (+),score=49.22 TRINITY_DN1594_c0_g2_i5:365-1027(+)